MSPQAQSIKRKFWLFLVPAFILWMIGEYFFSGFTVDQLNVVVPSLMEFKGWTTTAITNANTVGRIINIPLTFVTGTVIIKLGARKVLSFAMILLGVCELCVAIAGNYVMFFIGMCLQPMLGVAILMSTFSLCNAWFRKWRGTALGLVTLTSPLSSATLISYLGHGVAFRGYTATFATLGIIVVVVGALMAVLVRNTPEEVGCFPDAALEAPPPEILADEEGVNRIKIKHIMKYKESWCHFLCFGFMMFTIGAYAGFFVMRFAEIGLGQGQLTAMTYLYSICGAVLSFFSGVIDDKLGTRNATILLCALMLLGCIGFRFGSANALWMIVIGMIALGGVVGASPNLSPSMVVYLFGRKAFNRVYRLLNCGVYLLAAFGVAFVSVCYKATGNFKLAYTLMIVVGVIMLACALLMNRKRDLTEDVKQDEEKKAAA